MSRNKVLSSGNPPGGDCWLQLLATNPTANVGDRPLVVATTSVLCDLTRQVARETIDLACLVAPGEDPHVYQPKPDDR